MYFQMRTVGLFSMCLPLTGCTPNSISRDRVVEAESDSGLLAALQMRATRTVDASGEQIKMIDYYIGIDCRQLAIEHAGTLRMSSAKSDVDVRYHILLNKSQLEMIPDRVYVTEVIRKSTNVVSQIFAFEHTGGEWTSLPLITIESGEQLD